MSPVILSPSKKPRRLVVELRGRWEDVWLEPKHVHCVSLPATSVILFLEDFNDLCNVAQLVMNPVWSSIAVEEFVSKSNIALRCPQQYKVTGEYLMCRSELS